MIGTLLRDVADDVGLPSDTPVVAVGSHDTASAVVGVPSDASPSAYISSGTWSLVGLEVDTPILTEEARTADFTNEGGVDGTVRLPEERDGSLGALRVRAGLEGAGEEVDLPQLLAEAGALPPLTSVVDVDDPSLLPPDDMPGRLRRAREGGGRTRARHESRARADGAGQPGARVPAHRCGPRLRSLVCVPRSSMSSGVARRTSCSAS